MISCDVAWMRLKNKIVLLSESLNNEAEIHVKMVFISAMTLTPARC